MQDDQYNYDDVVPLPITTSASGELCQILYTDEYKELMGIARAMLQSREYSERALHLTGLVIDTVPAFYTIWNYRFNIVKTLFGDSRDSLNEELDWLDEFTLSNPKNYQIWSYRQSILQIYPEPSFQRELPVLHLMLEDDTKNYHVWSYRKWCVMFFKDFSRELAFADDFISRDVYNNSAWSHRMFVLKNTEATTALVNSEIKYAMSSIELAPQNVSPWNYLRGIYELFLNEKYDDEVISFASKFVGNFFESKEQTSAIDSSFALEFLAHVYSKDTEKNTLSIKAYDALSERYDPIRKSFWQYKKGELE